jgi:DNA-directed RNA polymerase specialized sigma24 family protein
MAEIAEQMGIPLSTLYKLRGRALVALGAEIERRMSLEE